MKEKNNQLTSGSVSQGIIRFALPLLGANIVQQLYNTVDLMFVGKLLGTDQQAAVGASSLFITCLVGLFGGISIGVGVTTSQFYGAEDENGVSRTIHTSFALSALAGIIMSLLGYWFSPWFISLIYTPKHLIPSAISYLRIYFLSLISVITYNISSGTIRAANASRRPWRASNI